MVTISKFKVTTSVTHTKEADATKRTKKTNKTTKFVSVKKTKLVMTKKYDDKAAATTNQQTAKISVKYSPTKVGYKGMKWKAKNKKIVYVSPYGVVTPLKKGSTKIYGYTKDGTNKKVTLNVTVKAAPVTATPTPLLEEDSRTATTVEDFESYAAGTTWKTYTAGGYTKSGSMTVVQDPENPKNKVLKVDYTGEEQAFDFAPVFNLTLPDGKALKDFSAIRLKSRVISNSSDCNYKTIGVYFDGYGMIKPSDYFYTSNYDGTDPKKAPQKEYRFGTKVSMATGVDQNYNVPDSVKPGLAIQDKDMIAVSPLKKYNNKVFPTYYQDYADGTDKEAVSPGYSENETNESNKVGFQQNTLEFDTNMIGAAWITDNDTTPLLDRNKLDMVLGSTYTGSQGRSADQWHLVLYLDDIQVMSGTIAVKELNFVNPPKKIACGTDNMVAGKATLELRYTPANTTQKEVTYSSSDDSLATVDANGIVTANSNGKTGNVTITATSKSNGNVKATTSIYIENVTPATEDYDVLGSTSTKIVAKSTDEKAKTKSETDNLELKDGQLTINYDATNQSVLVDLGTEINMNRYKGVEIVGNMPGALALEFYPESFDMTQTKDNGAEKDWWETCGGKTFPFYNGSTKYRTEAGGYNKNILKTKPDSVDSKGSAIATDEKIRFSLNKLAEAGTGDWSSIRYINIKSNNTPELPYAKFDAASKKEGRKTIAYTVKSLKLTAREVYDCDDGNRYTLYRSGDTEDTKENKIAASDTISLSYVDPITKTNTLEKHNAHKNIQDFTYIKVAVKDAASVKAGLVKNGTEAADYKLVGESTGVTTEKTLYYRIDNLGSDVDIHDVDAIAVELPEGGTISMVQLAQGEIAYRSTEPAQYDASSGTETAITEAAYGKD